MNLDEVFAAAMARLGPYGACPRLAIAVSGGADSTALALLTQHWSAKHNGTILAFVVDHGLRQESPAEAKLTANRLKARGIPAEILTISGLSGSAIQAQARAARYKALAQAAVREGRLHLLLGHHAADQSETVTMRAARGPQGTEGMAAWTARNDLLLLRPLLEVQPAVLRAYLAAQQMEWVEDPSNANRKFERVRVRQAGTDAKPAGADFRQARECEAAGFLARHASIRPEGFALLDASAAPPAALAVLIRVIGGAVYPPGQASIAVLAAKLRPATLGRVRICAPGRLGSGWLFAREPAYLAPPVPARLGAVWDRRFILEGEPSAGQKFGALGVDARKFKNYNGLSFIILCTMPCLLGPGAEKNFPAAARFMPPAPATSHPFRRA